MQKFDYVIVGAGLAGASAVKGVREEDQEGSILLVGEEEEFPYNRPPLSKDLLLGDKTVGEISIEDEAYFTEHEVELELGTEITEIDPDNNLVTNSRGESYEYEKLLLSTGGSPRKLDIPGGQLEGANYYRYLDDYRSLSEGMKSANRAVVIGGGFIGSEITAGLNLNDIEVSMVFPEDYLLERVFPKELAAVVQRDYEDRGVNVVAGDKPVRFRKESDGFEVKTDQGKILQGDLLIVGIGISPEDDLAKGAELKVFDGIEVDKYLQTSDTDIYAAGDNAYFPFTDLGESTRVEHWDNAKSQGKLAGRNMAGAEEAYNYVPYFFSDLFDFGFEAVGEVNSNLNNFVDWKKKGEKGVGYYLSGDGKVKGVLLLGVWGAKGDARDLIKSEESFTREELVGKIG
ncbi:MAG: FAD-dependent oxidoreductase [Candidatus Bipolaricaulota bacterium]|nr:FAD-dependent oxidoreductase [Candidatus Bipolaricaulota bacterium]MBS3792215.1 FAD-dependent oxidoreductase [Candidatus Bipolaricaulota bacterium]